MTTAPTLKSPTLKRKARVLIVDDSAVIRTVISKTIKSQEDMEVVGVAFNGDMGVRNIKTLNPDIVILDIEMPIMDGLTFARRVREDPQFSHIPLLALTTLNTPESRAAAKAAGFDAYEVKLDRTTLLTAVSQLLSISPQPAYNSCEYMF